MITIHLDNSFYKENQNIVEALDNTVGDCGNKIRGYGVVIININNLKFAIPERTNISHGGAFITLKNMGKKSSIRGRGLDYSKALLITDDKYIQIFLII